MIGEVSYNLNKSDIFNWKDECNYGVLQPDSDGRGSLSGVLSRGSLPSSLTDPPCNRPLQHHIFHRCARELQHLSRHCEEQPHAHGHKLLPVQPGLLGYHDPVTRYVRNNLLIILLRYQSSLRWSHLPLLLNGLQRKCKRDKHKHYCDTCLLTVN